MNSNIPLLSEPELLERIFDHIDNKTTDLGDTVRKEPVSNYLSEERFNSEIDLLRRLPVVFCLSAMLPDKGSYVARRVHHCSWLEEMMAKFEPLSTPADIEVCRLLKTVAVRVRSYVPTMRGLMVWKVNLDIYPDTLGSRVWS